MDENGYTVVIATDATNRSRNDGIIVGKACGRLVVDGLLDFDWFVGRNFQCECIHLILIVFTNFWESTTNIDMEELIVANDSHMPD